MIPCPPPKVDLTTFKPFDVAAARRGRRGENAAGPPVSGKPHKRRPAARYYAYLRTANKMVLASGLLKRPSELGLQPVYRLLKKYRCALRLPPVSLNHGLYNRRVRWTQRALRRRWVRIRHAQPNNQTAPGNGTVVRVLMLVPIVALQVCLCAFSETSARMTLQRLLLS